MPYTTTDLISAASALEYAAQQLRSAAHCQTVGAPATAEACVNLACQGLDSACDLLGYDTDSDSPADCRTACGQE